MTETLIVRNARIHTMNPRQPTASVLLIREGRIAAVGGEEITADGAAVMDAAGAVIVPGFIDTHVHFTITGLGLLAVDLQGLTIIDAALDRIARAAHERPVNGLVVASRFQPELNGEGRFPTMAELDRAGDGRPVYVMESGGHWSAVSRAAYAMLELTGETEGVRLDDDGEPTGVLTGAANMRAFTRLWKIFGVQMGSERAFQAAAERAVRGGVSTLHALDDLEDVRSMLAARDRLPVRIVPYTQSRDVAAVRALGLRQIGGCGQVAVDGDFGPHTAALLEPYADAPHTCGTLNYSQDELDAYVAEAHAAGLQMALHCVGSGAIELLLNSYERVLKDSPRPDHRHRLEHFELPARGQAERARRLGILLAMQPAFNHFWPHTGEYQRVVGPERAALVDPVRSVVEAGLEVSFGSDSPVTPLDGLLWIHSAVNHSNLAERIPARTALEHCTATASRFAFEEADKGTLEAGKLADFALLDGDPLSVPPEQIKNIQVLRMIVGGRTVFERDH